MAGGRPCRGFTLIEAIVVVAVIGVLVALLLPAVQAAREAARRMGCVGNLKQLALAAAGYEHQVGCYPMGNPVRTDARFPQAVLDGHSVFVALLPFLEQKPLFDAFNFDRSINYCDNATAIATRVAVLSCPSDHAAGGPKPALYWLIDAVGPSMTNISSYAGCSGMVYRYPASAAEIARMPLHNRQCDGVFFVDSRVRRAEIADGASNTLMFCERAHARLTIPGPDEYHWWSDGWMCDNHFLTAFPINPTIAPDPAGYYGYTAQLWAASSLHGGGANFAMCDGSVRFLKDSIDTMAVDGNGIPVGVAGNVEVGVTFAPGTRFGVYQHLGSRAGGEVVGADAY
ncbi:DUF1559 domain-containing protein [Paludisphaera mucosa]|uniref:DUF1559 domain-containing protein n=1 Tax=Paludisphaera mucosa TaxID=3030827 RepID=A0ABT6FL98_9BACT|nr:DUF1559 domain-containing protein [Paludisphaera mucosa]MDG3008344.1 DUF1559 domain-containing protein [Paludisphaera mucosa]